MFKRELGNSVSPLAKCGNSMGTKLPGTSKMASIDLPDWKVLESPKVPLKRVRTFRFNSSIFPYIFLPLIKSSNLWSCCARLLSLTPRIALQSHPFRIGFSHFLSCSTFIMLISRIYTVMMACSNPVPSVMMGLEELIRSQAKPWSWD